jgi:hypothetical protein
MLKPLRQCTSRVRICSGRFSASSQRSRWSVSPRHAGRTDGGYLHGKLDNACAETPLSGPNSTTLQQRRREHSDERSYASPFFEPTPPTNWLSIRSSALRVGLASPSGWRARVGGRYCPRAAQPCRAYTDSQS